MTQSIDHICTSFEKFTTLMATYFEGHYTAFSHSKNPIVALNTARHAAHGPRLSIRGMSKNLSNHQILQAGVRAGDVELALDEFLTSLSEIPLLDVPDISVLIEFSCNKKKMLSGVRLTIDSVQVVSSYLIPSNAVKRLRGFLKIIDHVDRGSPLKRYKVEDTVIHAQCAQTALLKLFAGYASSRGDAGLEEGKLTGGPEAPHQVVCLDDWKATWEEIADLTNTP